MDMITLLWAQRNEWIEKTLNSIISIQNIKQYIREKKKIACSITLRDVVTRIILCIDRIMLGRKDAAKGISLGGIQLVGSIFVHTTVQEITVHLLLDS